MSDEIRFEQVQAKVAKQAAVEGCVKCAICSQTVEGVASVCSECETVYHRDCWGYHGGCAIYGCSQTPDPERPIAVEIRAPGRGRVRRAIVALGALSCLTVGLALGFSAGHSEGWRSAELEVERQDALDDALDEAIDEAEMLSQLLVHAGPLALNVGPAPGAAVARCGHHGGPCGPGAIAPFPGGPIAGAVPGARASGAGPVGVGEAAQVVVDSAILEVDEKAADELGLTEGQARPSSHELQTSLMALEDEGRAHLVASPRLMSEDGREASLTIGDRGKAEDGSLVESSVNLTVKPELAGPIVRLTVKLGVVQQPGSRVEHALVIEAHDGQEMVAAVVPAAAGKRLVFLLAPHVLRGDM